MELQFLITLLGVVAEVAMLRYYYQHMLNASKGGHWQVGIYILTGLLMALISLMRITAEQRTCLAYIALLLPVFFYQGHILVKLLLTALFVMIHAGAELFCWGVLSLLHTDLQVSYDVHELVNYNQGVVLSKAISFCLLYIVVIIKKTKGYEKSGWRLSIYLLILLIMGITINQLAEASYIINRYGQRLQFVVTIFMIVLSNVLLFYLFDRQLAYEKLKQKLAVEAAKAELQWEHEKILETRERQMRGLRHDIKNHLAIVLSHIRCQQIAAAEQYLHKLNIVAERNHSIVTGYSHIDAILNIKKEQIEARQIRFDDQFSQPFILELEEMDLVTILANCLDNALEAVERLPSQPWERVITLYLASDADSVVLEVTNPIDSSVVYEGTNLPKTTKEDKEMHGLGLENIDHIVHHYQGTLLAAPEGATFVVKLLLPQQKK